MGKYSNAIKKEEKSKIICALKNVTPEMSSKRLIRPGQKYTFPPKQDKFDIFKLQDQKFESSKSPAFSQFFSLNDGKKLDYKEIQAKVQGLSFVVCKEISQKLEFENTDFKKVLSDLANVLKNGEEALVIVSSSKNNPVFDMDVEELKNFHIYKVKEPLISRIFNEGISDKDFNIAKNFARKRKRKILK